MKRIACVVGARPNLMKMAPILRAIQARPELSYALVHTGQHYDANLSDVFFRDLSIPAPDASLEVGSGRQGEQTARILERFEAWLEAENAAGRKVDRVLVVGDVNSTAACALAAVKMQIPVAHVEAGLRSFDRTMPEEINRIVTDSICDLLLVSEPTGIANLKREGHSESEMRLVGNVMIDTLKTLLPKARDSRVWEEYGLKAKAYGIVTLHRPSNVDAPETLEGILRVLGRIAEHIDLVFPVHPRTAARIESFGLGRLLESAPRLRVLPPLGYTALLGLTAEARLVVSDSGGLQEETTALGVPCLTMRENTERPLTVEQGTSTLVGNDPQRLQSCFDDVMRGTYKKGRCPELWDGQAAGRIAEALLEC